MLSAAKPAELTRLVTTRAASLDAASRLSLASELLATLSADERLELVEEHLIRLSEQVPIPLMMP